MPCRRIDTGTCGCWCERENAEPTAETTGTASYTSDTDESSHPDDVSPLRVSACPTWSQNPTIQTNCPLLSTCRTKAHREK